MTTVKIIINCGSHLQVINATPNLLTFILIRSKVIVFRLQSRRFTKGDVLKKDEKVGNSQQKQLRI